MQDIIYVYIWYCHSERLICFQAKEQEEKLIVLKKREERLKLEAEKKREMAEQQKLRAAADEAAEAQRQQARQERQVSQILFCESKILKYL